MEHVPTTESYIQRTIRIAKELDISIDKASIICDAFELAFSDLGSRQAILGMIEQLDESAAQKGEPAGLIINYGVEIGLEGIRVSRYADEVPPGEIVDLIPPDQASIFLRIIDDFPTQEVLGPLRVVKLRPMDEAQASVPKDGLISDNDNKLPFLDKERCPVGRGGLTGSEIAESEPPTDTSALEPAETICLGPIRLKLNERFPILAKAASGYRDTGEKAWSSSLGRNRFDGRISDLMQAGLFSSHSSQPTSGLSPPLLTENLEHSERKMFLRHLAIN